MCFGLDAKVTHGMILCTSMGTHTHIDACFLMLLRWLITYKERVQSIFVPSVWEKKHRRRRSISNIPLSDRARRQDENEHTTEKMDIVNSLVNIVFDRIKPIQLPEKDVKSVVLVSRYYI